MHVFSKQVSDKRDLHCKLLYWMYSTENREMPLTLKIFLYKFIKIITRKNKLTSIYQTSKLFRITQIIEIILHVSKLLHLEE